MTPARFDRPARDYRTDDTPPPSDPWADLIAAWDARARCIIREECAPSRAVDAVMLALLGFVVGAVVVLFPLLFWACCCAGGK